MMGGLLCSDGMAWVVVMGWSGLCLSEGMEWVALSDGMEWVVSV